jgi:hypothetical protein
MDDAGDLVPLADLQERRQVGEVGLLGDDPLAVQLRWWLRGAALDEHAGLTQVEQRTYGVRPDEPQAAGYQNHLEHSSAEIISSINRQRY